MRSMEENEVQLGLKVLKVQEPVDFTDLSPAALQGFTCSSHLGQEALRACSGGTGVCMSAVRTDT